MSFVYNTFSGNYVPVIMVALLIIAAIGLVKPKLTPGSPAGFLMSEEFWVAGHFIFWLTLGAFPDMTPGLAVVIMVGWEAAELAVSEVQKSMSREQDLTFEQGGLYFNETPRKKWLDMVANLSGYLLGRKMLLNS